MFERRDLFRSSYLFVVIFTIMFTLSQIFVVHRNKHGKVKSANRQVSLQNLINQMESSISSMMKVNHLSVEDNNQDINAYVHAERIRRLITRLRSTDNTPVRWPMDNKTKKCKHYNTYEQKTRKLQFMKTNVGQVQYKERKTMNRNVDQRRKRTYNRGVDDPRKSVRKSCMISLVTGEELDNNPTNVKDRKPEKNKIKDPCPLLPLESQFPDPMINTAPSPSPGNLARFSDILPGGIWKPDTCVARQRTAIIIPFRDRHKHLELLLLFLIPVLKRQYIDFRIFVVEQHGNKTFNKGRVMNAGFKEAWRHGDFDCFVFHDVDMVPENDKNMYTCHDKYPRHMSPAVDKFKYRLPYQTLVGGVLSMRPELFLQVNGYSNLYWGWGAEDDDMAIRFKQQRLVILRPPSPIGRFRMIKHERRETIPVKTRVYLLKTVANRYRRDGLNTLEHSLVRAVKCKLYTHVVVNIGEPPDDIQKMATAVP